MEIDMKQFTAKLFSLLYTWQEKTVGRKQHTAIYASATLGMLLAMNLMFICFLVSFLYHDLIISFLKSYYVLTSISIVLIVIVVLNFKDNYKILLDSVLQISREAYGSNRTSVLAYILVTVALFIVSAYFLYDEIYF
jgi:Na+-driven multidrug efflux pump